MNNIIQITAELKLNRVTYHGHDAYSKFRKSTCKRYLSVHYANHMFLSATEQIVINRIKLLTEDYLSCQTDKQLKMASDSSPCNGYFNEQGSAPISNYFSQLSASSVNSQNSSGSNSSVNSSNSRHQSSSLSSNSPGTNQWSDPPPQSQNHHHQHQQPQSQPQQQHQHQQSNQQQNNITQSLPTTSNAHPLFAGNFHHRTNNSWAIPNLSCYQRIYGDNHYNQNFHQPANAQHNGSNQNIGNQQQSTKRFGNPSGKSGNSKDICGDDKFKEDGDPWNVEAQTAFLGPNLWDKTLPYDADLKVPQYADLDEFLSENNIPDGLPGTHLGHSTSLGHRSESLGHSTGLSLGSLGHVTTKRERSPSPSDCVSPDTINPPSPAESTFSFASSGRDFDPRTRAFSDEELKPQPMIKKSRKQFVPDELKDDKYWARRRKNNIAAKRSRDARRQKENQIAMRARYLEKENSSLHHEVEQLKQENMELRARLSKYQEV